MIEHASSGAYGRIRRLSVAAQSKRLLEQTARFGIGLVGRGHNEACECHQQLGLNEALFGMSAGQRQPTFELCPGFCYRRPSGRSVASFPIETCCALNPAGISAMMTEQRVWERRNTWIPLHGINNRRVDRCAAAS
jgi:hypothetical protein